MARAKLVARIGYVIPLLLALSVSRSEQGGRDLYAQAASAMLDRSFPPAGVSYLLLDLRTRRTIAMRWPHADAPIPVGSLLKPFLALAYSQTDSNSGDARPVTPRKFPVVLCHGKADGCWRPGGHGSLALEQAVAKSCNAYFLALVAALAGSGDGAEALHRVSAAFGLPAPPVSDSPRTLIGATPEWRVSPVALAHAYAALASQSGVVADRLLTGMRLAAGPGGTAERLGVHPGGVLAKTGTAPCRPGSEVDSSRCIANGDGLVVVLFPAQNPRQLLLVRERGVTGAQTAELAGRMVTLLEDPYAQTR